MTPEQIVTISTELIYAALREFQSLMATPLANPQIGSFVRILPILALPFGAMRALSARAWTSKVLGMALIFIELYFIYNRLTVFAIKPLVVGELIGNAGLMMLGVLLLLPQRYWDAQRRKEN